MGFFSNILDKLGAQTVLTKLAANGGNVPKEMLY